MNKNKLVVLFMMMFCFLTAYSQLTTDSYHTPKGELKVTVLGHASLIFEYQDKIIYVDPYSQVADFSVLPKADLILLTHEHADHLDTSAISMIQKETTHFIASQVCNEILGYGAVLQNGDTTNFENIVSIDAVPAYNIASINPSGVPYHPKGRGNGYVLSFDCLKVYVAGDTENIPEMSDLSGIEIAFLPKNIPYTMTDDMFVDAALKVRPKYLYPYHFSEFDAEKFNSTLGESGITLCIRSMKNK